MEPFEFSSQDRVRLSCLEDDIELCIRKLYAPCSGEEWEKTQELLHDLEGEYADVVHQAVRLRIRQLRQVASKKYAPKEGING